MEDIKNSRWLPFRYLLVMDGNKCILCSLPFFKDKLLHVFPSVAFVFGP